MQHSATSPDGPAFSSGSLFAGKPVLYGQQVSRKRFLVINMPVLLFEIFIRLVANIHDSILYAEGFTIIIIQLMSPDLDGPVLEIFPVAQLDPFGLGFLYTAQQI